AYSEAGGYSGYSYLRLRGIDQTRLNITLDGVPLNDPEDQVLYFSNVPDFLNSMQSVQLQRGVGSSTFGTASYAGSLNAQSLSLATTPRGGELDLTGGSFNTMRASAQYATGVLPGGFAAYARVSKHHTDGYRYHSGNDAQSGFLSAGWFGDRQAVKFTGMAGVSGTRMAYLAAPESILAIDPRTNPLTDHEGDRFHQEMASLQYTRALSDGVTWTVTGYRNSAAGAYDVDFGDGTIGNYFLAHVWYGAFTALTVREGAWSLDAGAHASDYHREHALAMRPTLNDRAYTNVGHKQEQSAFAKLAWDDGAWRWSADLQVRHAAFRYVPDKNAGIGEASTDWTFVNPKVGVTWRAAPELSLYASYGRTGREPARGDLFAGADDLNSTNAASILPLTRVQPEQVGDLEVGGTWTSGALTVSADLFDMEFHDEIAAIGKLSLTGNPLRQNVDRSYRRGVEGELSWKVSDRVTATANLAVMQARIADYTDESVGVTYHDVEPLMTPPVVSNQRVDIQLSPEFSLSLGGRYVDRARLANDGDARMVTPAAWLADGGLTWQRGLVDVRLQVNNALDARAEAGGYSSGGDRYFYPVAARNLLLTTTLRF
ncbi:MAG: TonB-dependent receptor, partial [Gemmatimonadetes bacterium]|nr:TonB-dependent receptor [Gemmatimonadota bacterium]